MGHAPKFMSSGTPAADAGACVARALIAADRARGAARLAIPGGSAVPALRPALALLPAEVLGRLRLTWVDERCVPTDDEQSNRGAARRAGLLPGCAVTVPLWWDGAGADEAAAQVSARLQQEFAGGLDVALLGLGEDGHIASLFPGHPALDLEGPVLHVQDSPKPPARRMTLSLPLLREAGTCVLLATGAGKRAALERLRQGDPALPATALARLIVFTDLEA